MDPPKRHNGIPDDGIVSCVTALGCLRSPPISSIIADVKNAKSSNQGQHRCLPKGAAASPGPATSTALDDLIHLPGPLTEDAVLKCLQARFCAKQYHVSLLPNRFVFPNLNLSRVHIHVILRFGNEQFLLVLVYFPLREIIIIVDCIRNITRIILRKR